MAPASSLSLPRPFGPYELVRQLAVGGMAEVFVARARSVAGFEKVVALKMIHPRFSEDPEFARLLVEEANITAQLSHRNIVQVIDLGQIDGTHYIAMEYVDGMDLSRLLSKMRERNQRCSPRFAAYVVREVCDGLEHAHRKVGNDGKPLKIVHRDVSPPNILVSSAGEVKLTDFGIAKAALRASSTEAGVVKGKYAYMPPEQAKGAPLDARADVFSAGCVLYELATGQPVYKDAPLPVLLDRVSRGVFDAPEKVRPDLPPALVAVIKKALAISADARYSNARAMADELNAFLYTLPPNPEFEVSQIVSGISEASRASMPPMAGVSLFDDDEEISTQIESMATMRSKMTDAPGASGNTAKHAAVKPAAAAAVVKAHAPDPDAFTDEPTRAMPRGKFAGVLDGQPPVDDDEPEPTVQGVRPNTAAPRVMGAGDGAAGPTVRPAAGRPATASSSPSATASAKPAGNAPLPSSGPRPAPGSMGGAKPAVPTAGTRPMPAAEPKLPARKPTLMGAAVAPTAPPTANPPPAPPGVKKPSLPPPPPAAAKRQSLPPPPPGAATRSATASGLPAASKPGPPPIRTPALPPAATAQQPKRESPPAPAPSPATQSAPPSFGQAPAPMQQQPMQQQPMQQQPMQQQPMQQQPMQQQPMQQQPMQQQPMHQQPMQQAAPSSGFGGPPASQPNPQGGFGAAPNGGFGQQPAQAPNAFGSDPFGQQQQGFGQPAPQNMPGAFAPTGGAAGGYSPEQQAQQQQRAMQRAAQAAEDDKKQRRAVIIAGAFAVIGVAALMVVLFAGR